MLAAVAAADSAAGQLVAADAAAEQLAVVVQFAAPAVARLVAAQAHTLPVAADSAAGSLQLVVELVAAAAQTAHPGFRRLAAVVARLAAIAAGNSAVALARNLSLQKVQAR